MPLDKIKCPKILIYFFNKGRSKGGALVKEDEIPDEGLIAFMILLDRLCITDFLWFIETNLVSKKS